MNHFDVDRELSSFEKHTTDKSFDLAARSFKTILDHISPHVHIPERAFHHSDSDLAKHLTTRFVAVSLEFLCDPAFGINDTQFELLCSRYLNFHLVVGSTHFQNCSHGIKRLMECNNGNLDRNVFNKLLFMWRPGCGISIPFENFIESHGRSISSLAVTALALYGCVKDEEKAQAEELIRLLADQNLQVVVNEGNLNTIAQCWMFLSYSESPHRLRAKKMINDALRAFVLGQGATDANNMARTSLERPVAAFVLEQFKRGHAMDRAYRRTILDFKDHFRVVGFGWKGSVDQPSLNLFDHFEFLPDGPEELASAAKIIEQAGARILCYLSLGMHSHSLPLANLRLAERQYLFPGHCDTSAIETIDAIILPRALSEKDLTITEQVVNHGSYSPIFPDVQGSLPSKMPAKLSAGSGRFVFAVPSSIMKLSASFIDVLQRIQLSSNIPTEFHFFPGCRGFVRQDLVKRLERVLNHVEIFEPMPYEDYLVELARCDAHLGPFPYANASGNVDSYIAGLPMVALVGDDLRGRQDKLVIEALAPSDFQLCNSKDAYVRAAIRLINRTVSADETPEQSRRWKSVSPLKKDQNSLSSSLLETLDLENHFSSVSVG